VESFPRAHLTLTALAIDKVDRNFPDARRFLPRCSRERVPARRATPVERKRCRRTRKPARASSSITPKKAKPRISAKKAGA
jgi:hypothetical protein